MASFSTAESSKTAAELMKEQHEAGVDHHATVEDIPDEDDLQHPPPAHTIAGREEASVNGAKNPPLSAKAAGKQKVQEKSGGLDTTSEEAFPALGGGPRAQPAPSASSWGGKPLSSKILNGTSPQVSRPSSSGANTPASNRGTATPAPAYGIPIAQQLGQAPNLVSLPGRNIVPFEISKAELDKTKLSQVALNTLSRKMGVKVTLKELTNSVQFLVSGPQSKVNEVMRIINEEYTLKLKRSVEIPASVKSHIIGRGGSNVIALQKKFSVKIQVQDKNAPAQPSSQDSDAAIVEISGHAGGVRSAEQEILRLVKERQPKIDRYLREIEPRYNPFIERHFADQIDRYRQDHDVHVQIPSFAPQASQSRQRAASELQPDYIMISGDPTVAAQAQAELEQLADRLQEQLHREELQIPFNPYMVGDRGMSQQDFFNETGCLFIPPDEGGEIVVFGPKERLPKAIDKVNELAENIIEQSVDTHRTFFNADHGADAQSRAIARYLRQRQIEEDFRQKYNTDVVFPTPQEAATNWRVFGQENRNVRQAQGDLMKIAQAYPPQRLRKLPVDPFFHPHLPDLFEAHLRDQFKVHLLSPELGEDHIILIYEGDTEPDSPFEIPRTKPTAAELDDFVAILQQAENHVRSRIPEDTIIVNRSLDVPHRYHEDVRRFTRKRPPPAVPDIFPVRVDYDVPDTAGNTIQLSAQNDDLVEELQKAIQDEIARVQENEKLRHHKTIFDFPDKLKDRLVGRQGAHVNKLKSDFEVEVDTKTPGKVELRGPPKLGEACRDEIMKLQKQWEDEVVYKVKVDPKHMGYIAGKNGENLAEIRRRTKQLVDIRLPPNSKSRDDQSVADNTSETASVRPSRNQAPNEIVIRGPRKLADDAKAEIEGLAGETFEATISVARGQIASIIGRGGSEIDSLRSSTQTRIDLPKASPSAVNAERVEIIIRGSKDNVARARAELQKRAKAYDDILTREIEIDQQYHQSLIGPQGTNLRSIVEKAGGSSTEAVQFPRKGTSSNNVTVTGTTTVVNDIVKALQSFAAEQRSKVNESIEVSKDKHRLLIGAGGETRRALERDFGVNINIPRANEDSDVIKILGKAEDVAKAKAEIERRTAGRKGVTIEVPTGLHYIVSDDGRLFRQLRSKQVTVDHGPKPPKPEESVAAATNGAMPLITEDSDELPYTWNMTTSGGSADGGEGSISWVLSGPPEAVAAAKAQIEQKLQSARQPKTTGHLRLPDPALHKHIIGRGGNKINQLRDDTNCDIQVPRNGGGPITIVGSEEACEEAKRLILEAVESGRASNQRGRPSSRA